VLLFKKEKKNRLRFKTPLGVAVLTVVLAVISVPAFIFCFCGLTFLALAIRNRFVARSGVVNIELQPMPPNTRNDMPAIVPVDGNLCCVCFVFVLCYFMFFVCLFHVVVHVCCFHVVVVIIIFQFVSLFEK
jgi:hypothetical protein